MPQSASSKSSITGNPLIFTPESQISVLSSVDHEDSPLCIEIMIEPGKKEKIVLTDYPTLDAIMLFLTQKYSIFPNINPSKQIWIKKRRKH